MEEQRTQGVFYVRCRRFMFLKNLGVEIGRFFGIRQQTEKEINDCFACLSDYIAPR